MAIVDMKRITLLAMNQDKQRLMSRMQRLGCVQVIERPDAERQRISADERPRRDELNKLIDRLDLSIKRLNPYDKIKRGLLSMRPVAGDEQLTTVLAGKSEWITVMERVEQIERTRGELRAQEARYRALLDQITPWAGLNVPLEKIGSTKTSELMLLSVPVKRMDEFSLGISELDATQMEEISRLGEGINLLVGCHKTSLDGLMTLIKDNEVSRVSFPEMTGLASLQLDQLDGKIKRLGEVRLQLDEEVQGLADHLPMLRILRDHTAMERDQLSAASMSENTKSTFLLSGWAPGSRTEQIERELKAVSPLCEIDFRDPTEDEVPPTLLRNGKIVSPFETIVRMFSMPDPHGIDPTFVMLPFWICFFGMMVSDAGYGIVLGLAGGYAFHKLGRKSGMGRMAFIIMMGGLATIFWGAMYGGWFAIDGIPPILFAPMDKPLEMVILCLAIGVVHIFAGLGMGAYLNFKRGKPLDAFYDQFSWILLIVGLLLLIVNQTLGMIVAGIGLLTILLMAGRDKKNPLKRLMSGLGALYGISGYLSDILSYARLFGMGLATGVIGMVFNTLAGMLMGSPIGMVFAVILLIFGHTFNLLINTLGAYVHSCRLQFIEFFSKFYESGGKDFMPLSANTKYVDIDQGDAAA